MTDDRLSIRQLLKQRRDALGWRPSEQDLVAYLSGEGSDQKTEKIREYLALDPDLAMAIADLELSAAAPTEDRAGLTRTAEVDAAWRRFQHDLPKRDSGRPFRRAAAFGVLLIASALLFWLTHGNDAPTLEEQTAYLNPENVALRGPSDGEKPPRATPPRDEIRSAGHRSYLTLYLVDSVDFESYSAAIEIPGESADVSSEFSGIERGSDGAWRVDVPAGVFRHGLNRVHLYGTDNQGRRELVATYLVEVLAP